MVIAGSAYAFAAANTLSDTTIEVGYSSDTVAGYTIDNVAYDLVDTAPNTVDAMTFTISPTTATVVQVKIDASGSWETCSNSSGTVTCTFSSAYNVVDIDTFDAVISSSDNAVD